MTDYGSCLQVDLKLGLLSPAATDWGEIPYIKTFETVEYTDLCYKVGLHWLWAQAVYLKLSMLILLFCKANNFQDYRAGAHTASNWCVAWERRREQ